MNFIVVDGRERVCRIVETFRLRTPNNLFDKDLIHFNIDINFFMGISRGIAFNSTWQLVILNHTLYATNSSIDGNFFFL